MKSEIQTTMAPALRCSSSSAMLWTGRIIIGLTVTFLLFDAVTKIMKELHVLAANAELGYPQVSVPWIGALLLLCTVVYVISRSAVLGAILLTGYLGGAVASNVRVGHPVFECMFPAIFGVLVWAGLLLRDPWLRQVARSRNR
jgi:hypothetical protein